MHLKPHAPAIAQDFGGIIFLTNFSRLEYFLPFAKLFQPRVAIFLYSSRQRVNAMTGRVGASSIPQQAGGSENLRWTVPNIPSSSLERTRTASGHPRTVPIGASTFWPEAFRHRHRAMGTAIWLAFSHHTVEYPTQRESETRACNFEAMPSSAVWPEPPTAASLRQTDSPMRK